MLKQKIFLNRGGMSVVGGGGGFHTCVLLIFEDHDKSILIITNYHFLKTKGEHPRI